MFLKLFSVLCVSLALELLYCSKYTCVIVVITYKDDLCQ